MGTVHEIDDVLDTVRDISGLLKQCIENEKRKKSEFDRQADPLERRYAELEVQQASLRDELERLEAELEDVAVEQTSLKRQQASLTEMEHKLRSIERNGSTVAMVHDLGDLEETLRMLEDRLLLLEDEAQGSWVSQTAMDTSTFLSSPRRGGCAKPHEAYAANVTKESTTALLSYIESQYTTKPGSVLDELIENLVGTHPKNSSAHIKDTLIRLAYGARALRARPSVQAHEPTRNLHSIELLILWLYTAHGADIDGLMGFEVPDVANKKAWAAYLKRYATMESEGRKRNGCVFSEVNWAMRELGKGGNSSPPIQAEQTIYKWVKFITVLTNLTARHSVANEQCGTDALYRGFGGQSDDAYESMTRHGALVWPAFSSCALDRSVSVSYIDGTAANASAKEGGAVLFTINTFTNGFPLWHISQYPDEKELLLPPLVSFEVLASTESDELRFKCLKSLRKQGKSTLAQDVKASIVTLKMDGSRASALNASLNHCGKECSKVEARFKAILDGVDEIAAPDLINDLREKKREADAKLRNLTYSRDKLRQKIGEKNCLRVEQALHEDQKAGLDERLETLQTMLCNEEEELIKLPERTMKYGKDLTTAMLYLKGLVVNLATDWRFIKEIFKTYGGEAAAEGIIVAFTHIKNLIQSEYGEQPADTRWHLHFASEVAVSPYSQDDLVSAMKQLVVCYDMLPSNFDQNRIPYKEITLNVDILCEVYTTSLAGLRGLY